ncbi:MAG: hypothetical protein JWQ27_941 [Ferruginibacter sp.]|nr:hypothetical protein [Ferruginibacter sp.]
MTRITFFLLLLAQLCFVSCHTTKKINTAIAPKDTSIIQVNSSARDSLLFAQSVQENLRKNYLDFRTFSAKIKVDIEDAKGKQPDITAVVRIIKDSAIWMSLSATFLNIEVYRILITKDSVILLNKQAKEVQYRSLDYLQDVTQIPFDYKTVQDLLIGNPIFFDSSNATVKKSENFVLVSSVGKEFKNLLTLTIGQNLLQHSKLDDVDLNRNRTADVTYDEYTTVNGYPFSTYRQIIATEKNKLDIRMNFKQFEFNKELSVAFSIPKNYKKK